MSSNLSPQSPMRPLSIGNVVSAGFRIYGSHFNNYLRLALFSSLWSLVPIYGWAKAATIAALISRLAFGELISQPESVEAARDRVNPKLWNFFVANLLVGLIFGGLFIAFYITIIIISVGAILATSASGSQPNPGSIAVLLLLGGVLLIAFIVAVTWLYSRLMLFDLPIAVENNIEGTKSISRSWELTKGFVFRIQGVVIVAFLITLPLYIIVQIAVAVIQGSLLRVYSSQSTQFLLISYIVAYFLGLVSNLFIMPFWQAIKAVIYYDLRSRREGLGLQLRDRRPI